MARQSQYGEEQKSKIIQAAIAAKAKGKWSDALKAAQDEGYKGGLKYLVILVRGKATPKKAKAAKRGRPKGSKNKAARRGPGRPSKTAARRGPGRPPKSASNGAGLGQINGIVTTMVEQRTRDVLRNALAALKQASRAIERAL